MELTVPDQICLGVQSAEGAQLAPSADRAPTLTILGFSIHDVSLNKFDQEL
jgi:hypothetical protein